MRRALEQSVFFFDAEVFRVQYAIEIKKDNGHLNAAKMMWPFSYQLRHLASQCSASPATSNDAFGRFCLFQWPN
jgi:hypothetical protein